MCTIFLENHLVKFEKSHWRNLTISLYKYILCSSSFIDRVYISVFIVIVISQNIYILNINIIQFINYDLRVENYYTLSHGIFHSITLFWIKIIQKNQF